MVNRNTLSLSTTKRSGNQSIDDKNDSTPELVKRSDRLTHGKLKKQRNPSELRVNALDAELSKLSKVWRSHRPLSLGIQDQIFQFIGMGHLSASKRVVRALLRKHCQNPNYLRNTVEGEPRCNLLGDMTGQVLPDQADNAKQRLAMIEKAKAEQSTKRKPGKRQRP